jgi:hypothetical protein
VKWPAVGFNASADEESTANSATTGDNKKKDKKTAQILLLLISRICAGRLQNVTQSRATITRADASQPVITAFEPKMSVQDKKCRCTSGQSNETLARRRNKIDEAHLDRFTNIQRSGKLPLRQGWRCATPPIR